MTDAPTCEEDSWFLQRVLELLEAAVQCTLRRPWRKTNLDAEAKNSALLHAAPRWCSWTLLLDAPPPHHSTANGSSETEMQRKKK
ncbi:uncharacterized protein HKW66_Vig0174850 [Vigna angularis]|uniref:Uncharacterized protein n=1 Tax=Phaseolus angularis TaxID=3914 RepID=A0A8T0JPV0_PHAAN|nr:uncharacterized protein HKW66_Vig0174850 [Vigna angularis]